MTKDQAKRWKAAICRALFGMIWCALLLDCLRQFGFVIINPYLLCGVLTVWCIPGWRLYEWGRQTIQFPRCRRGGVMGRGRW